MAKSIPTVLIIDLSQGGARDYQYLLQQNDEVSYQFSLAASETQILALSRSHQFDIIILDSHQSDRSASTLIEWLKTQLGEKCPPIIVVDRNDARLATRAIKAGAVDYLVREELSADILVQSLQEAISSKQNHSSQYLTADLKNTQLLHDLSTRLVTEKDIQVFYDEIMATAIALTQADAGTVQILEEETQDLLLLATQGFEPSLTDRFYRVNANSNTPCGIALAKRERTFIDFDVPTSEDPDGSLRIHLEAGFYSAQSTPLISRSGKTIGMVSTHWCQHHRPTERELRFLDLLARQAADLIEQRQAQAVLRESEARLQSIANLVADLLWDSEPDGSTNWYNQRWMEYTGQTFEQAIGWGWTDAIHPDDRATSARRYHEAVQQGVQLQQEHRIRRYDGEYRWFVVKASPMKDEGGKVIKMYGAATDIHEQRVALETLRDDSEAKYRMLFTSIDEGFTLLEMIPDESGHPVDFRIVETNPAWEQQTGLTDAVGKTLLEITPNFEPHLFDFYIDVAISGRGRRTEYYTASTDRWYTVYASRIGGEESRLVTVVFNDISDRKRTEERQAFLLKLGDTLRAEPDANSVANRAVRMLAEYLHLDRFWLSEVFEQQDISTVGPEYHRPDLPPMSGVFRLSDYPETMRQLATQPMFIHDAASDSAFSDSEKALLEQLHLRALLVVALRKGQHQVIWAMTAAMTTPRHWNESERVLLEEVGEYVWAAIERARAETALREAELQRVREQERAETLTELDRAKTKFFSNISHEFRTPLTLLLAPLEDALSDLNYPLPEPQQERLELAHRNSLRLLKLVNSLLDFSRVEAGRLQANYEPTDLATYTVDLASTFRSAIENGGLEFVVDCPPLPESVYVDRQMWEKIVLNLLNNAFKFTFEGTIAVSLQAVSEERVQLIVKDTGIGIAAEELPQIFDRFYQSQGRGGRSSEGSGIGLSLVRELVKLHGGEIEGSSEVDRGTTFTVTIPTGQDHLPNNPLQQNETKSVRELPTPTSTARTANSFVAEAERWLPQAEITPSSELSTDGAYKPRGCGLNQVQPLVNPVPNSIRGTAPYNNKRNNKRGRILIVDDNADLRNYLQRLLERDYQVTTANNGLAALNKIRAAVEEDSSNYDLVLADIMMPEMDGFELLRSLRADAHTQEIPIILLSARAGEESRVEGLAAGADDYLIKPFSPRELLARVNTHLQLVRMREEATYRQRVMEEIQQLNATLEARVQERTARLQAVNQELEAFSYSVSHDLQTPLTYISSFAQKLQTKLSSTELDEISQSYLKIIVEAIEQSRTMVQNLLVFSRMGQTPLHLTSVSMNLLVQQVQEYLSPQLDERIVHWQIKSLPEVRGDREMLRLVLQNLLSNAVKYTSDRRDATITIGSSDSEGETIFWVRDNGIGFEMKYYDRLFGFFQRLHSQEQFKGTGIGLAQVRRIIHRHGGRIWAEGAVDAGATFYFSLPK